MCVCFIIYDWNIIWIIYTIQMLCRYCARAIRMLFIYYLDSM